MVESLIRTLQSNGLHLMLGPSGETKAQEAAMIEAMLAQRPCAMVLHNTRHTDAARSRHEGILRRRDENMVVAAMIEDQAGLHNVEAIVGVPGVDCIMVGQNDFAQMRA